MTEQGKEAIKNLDARMVEAALPRDLKLGLTTSQGLSIGALIGLLATKNGISLPLASWGAGTRRMTALEISLFTEKEASVTIIDEIERGLEPYRLRKLINVLRGAAWSDVLDYPQPGGDYLRWPAPFWRVLGQQGRHRRITAREDWAAAAT